MVSASSEPPRRAGRPRDEAVTARILSAARLELAAAGVDNFSIRQVARRAQVTRKAVAARWPNPEELLYEALGAIDELRFEPTGDLADDLTELGAVFISGLRSGALDLQLRVTADAADHPEVYRELQKHVLDPMSHALVRTFKAAQDAGQVRSGNVTWLVRAFVGSLLATIFQDPSREAPSATDLQELIAELRSWAAPHPHA